MRESLHDVPLGIASMTDRLLPHLFPTTDRAAFAATLTKAVGIDRPPPRDARRRATALGVLSDAATWNFFSEDAAGRRSESAVAGRPRPLAPFAIAAALLPLGFLLWRRTRT